MSIEQYPIDHSDHPARSSADTTGHTVHVVVRGPREAGKSAIVTAIALAMRYHGVEVKHFDTAFTELSPAERQNEVQVKKPQVTLFEFQDTEPLHGLVDEFELSARGFARRNDPESTQALKREVHRMQAVLTEINSWQVMQGT